MRLGKIAFFLLPEFSLYGVVPMLEALRLANQNSGSKRFEWMLLSRDGGPVRSSSGISLPVSGAIADVQYVQIAIVCGGNHSLQYIDRPLTSWLRRLFKHGAEVGGIDNGVLALAEAGLLDGIPAVVHWEWIDYFREHYPRVRVADGLFVFHQRRLSCAGGIAALDMMLFLIAEDAGADVARSVSDGLVYHEHRQPTASQPRLSRTAPAAEPRVQRMIAVMEKRVETPLSPEEVAERTFVSVRQLERLCRRYKGQSPMQIYLRIRLEVARAQLFQSAKTVKEIAVNTGFGSSQAFCRSFRREFGMSPLAFRSQHSTRGLESFRSFYSI